MTPRAFTVLEVLLAIALLFLLGIPTLFESISMYQKSIQRLHEAERSVTQKAREGKAQRHIHPENHE